MNILISRIIVAWTLVLRRSLAQWRLLSSVVVGVLLASTLMAGTVVYFDSLRELALRYALSQRSDTDLDIVATADMKDTSLKEYERVSSVINRYIDQGPAWLVSDRIGAGNTATFYFSFPGEEKLAGKDDRRAYFAFAPGWEQNITILPGGRMPQADPLNLLEDALELEAIVPEEAAELLGVKVGDQISVIPYWEDTVPYLRVRISGVFKRNTPDEEFWYLYENVLQSGKFITVRALPLFVSKETYLGVLGPAFSNLNSTYAWLLNVDTERLHADNTAQALLDIKTSHNLISETLSDSRLITSLFPVIKEYDRKLFFTKVPMLVFLVLMIAVILYYVGILSALLSERQSSDVALLRSRGATSFQVLGVFVLEGVTISSLAAVVGPFLAAGAISLLGLTPIFSELTGNTLIEVNVGLPAYMMSTLGGLLSFGVLMIPAIQACRIDVIGHRQQITRPSKTPMFQRYYLDVLLLIISVLLFRQLTEQGSVLATDLFGEVVVNHILLVVPGLVLVALSMVLLRLFPFVMTISSRLLSRWLSAGLILGLWQLARNPTHYGRLTLLLTLTAGLGIFSASFIGTLERSFRERIVYSTGADIRVIGMNLNNHGLSRNLVDVYEANLSIDHASPVYRGYGSDLNKGLLGSFTVLGVEDDLFNDIAELRDDFSSKPMNQLLKSLRKFDQSDGIQLPVGSRVLGVTLKASRPDPDVRVYARIKDSNDRYSSYFLGRLGETDSFGNLKKSEWKRLETSLSGGSLHLKEPLTLVSLGVHAPRRAERLRSGSIFIDDVMVGMISREHGSSSLDIKAEIIEPFDESERWSRLQLNKHNLSDDLRETEGLIDDKTGIITFSWPSDNVMISHGIMYGQESSPLPVLASKSFLQNLQYSIGEEVQVYLEGRMISVRVLDSIDFFPTLNPYTENFLVADLDSLVWFANLDPIPRDEFHPNEVWLNSQSTEVDRERLIQSLAEEPFEAKFTVDQQKQLVDSKIDPLAKIGWNVLLFVAFLSVFSLSCVGFLTHAYISFRAREKELALLRTFGLSIKQLASLLWLEQVVVLGIGMGLGTWIGGRIVSSIMPFMAHDDIGGKVVPPFAIEVNWALLMVTYISMLVVFGMIVFGVVWFVRRTPMQRVLRMGDM